MGASDELAQFNMAIDFRDKHFSGLLLVKQTAKDTYRILFGSHFGLSIFDFELTPDTFIVHSCVEPLRKKRLLKLLSSDFSTLLGLTLKEENPAIVYSPEKGGTDRLFKLTKSPSKGLYLTDQSLPLTKQIQTGKCLTKGTFRIPKATSNKIEIIHSTLKLTIGIEKLHIIEQP